MEKGREGSFWNDFEEIEKGRRVLEERELEWSPPCVCGVG